MKFCRRKFTVDIEFILLYNFHTFFFIRDFSTILHYNDKNELSNVNNLANILLNDDLESFGRRIVDIGFLLQTIREIKHSRFQSTFSDLKFERKIRQVLQYIYLQL